MTYEKMSQEEVHDMIVDLTREIAKAAYSDNLQLVISVNGKMAKPYFRITEMSSEIDVEEGVNYV